MNSCIQVLLRVIYDPVLAPEVEFILKEIIKCILLEIVKMFNMIANYRKAISAMRCYIQMRLVLFVHNDLS